MAASLNQTSLRMTTANLYGNPLLNLSVNITPGTGITTSPNPITGAGSVALIVPVVVSSGGTGATTLTGLLQGNGTSPITGGATVSLTTQVTGILPYANGGTNASTAWATGSVIFAGASGFAQDNANYFWDGTNHRLGLGTASPNVTLDINGPYATRQGSVAISNGLNSNIPLPANSYVRITGPTGAYSIGGFTGGTDGRQLEINGTVAQTLTIVNEDLSSTAANRISTPTGVNIIITAGAFSSANFTYDSTAQRWIYFESIPSGVYVKVDGTVPLTANWNAGNFSMLSRNSMDVYNVKAYGAVGDGTTDDTIAINNAAAACVATGGTIEFPVGFYKMTLPLAIATGTRGVRIRGEKGSYATPGNSIGSTILWAGSASITMLPLLNTQDIEIRDICLDGANTATSTAISLISNGTQSCKRTTIENVMIRRVSTGLQIGDGTNNQVDSVWVRNTAFYEGDILASSAAVRMNCPNIANTIFDGDEMFGWRYGFNITSTGDFTILNTSGGNTGAYNYDFIYVNGFYGRIGVYNSQAETGGGVCTDLNVTASATGPNASQQIVFEACSVGLASINAFARITTIGCAFNASWTYAAGASKHLSINDSFPLGTTINVGATGTKVTYINSDAISVGAAPSTRVADFYQPAGSGRVRITGDSASNVGYELAQTGVSTWTMYNQGTSGQLSFFDGTSDRLVFAPASSPANSPYIKIATRVAYLPSVFFTQTANGTTTANTLTSLFGTGAGTLTFPANFFLVSRHIRVRIGGYVSTADGGAGTKTLTLTLGGVTIATGTSGATFTTVLNNAWEATADFCCRIVGVGGTFIGGARFETMGATANFNGVLAVATGVATINTTGTLVLDLTFNNGNATGILTSTWASVETING